MGIDFSYRSENRRGWLLCTIATMLIILITTLTYMFLLQSSHPIQLCFVFIIVIQNCALAFMPISFIVLLCGVRQRYAALNSHLR